MHTRYLIHVLALGCITACSEGRTEKDVPQRAAEDPRPFAVAPVAAGSLPADSAAAVAILESLKAIAPTGGSGFDIAFAPRIRAASVLAVVSDSGLTLHDVNEEADTTIHLTRQDIEAQLTARRGRAFKSLVHFAHIYSQPYPQYSALACAHVPAGLEVKVGGWYELTFAREAGRLRLRRVSYVEYEGG